MVMNTEISGDLMSMLVEAIAREMKVSMQYMLQHTLCAEESSSTSKAAGFAASHRAVFLPGKSLKKIAITEMTHAELSRRELHILAGSCLTNRCLL